jgi:hypothetical protein
MRVSAVFPPVFASLPRFISFLAASLYSETETTQKSFSTLEKLDDDDDDTAVVQGSHAPFAPRCSPLGKHLGPSCRSQHSILAWYVCCSDQCTVE